MSTNFTLLYIYTTILSYPYEIIAFNKYGIINAKDRDNNNKKFHSQECIIKEVS